jgi:hypothetical protein
MLCASVLAVAAVLWKVRVGVPELVSFFILFVLNLFSCEE